MMSKLNHRSWVLSSLGAAGITGLVFACSGGGGSNLNGYDGGPGGGGGGGPMTGDDAGPITGITDPSTAGSDGGLGPQTQQFQPVSPAVYVAKIKDLVLGLPPTDAEVKQVTDDPTTFRAMVVGWMAQPGFQGKMLSFFGNAFQQNQVNLNAFEANTNFPLDNWINGGYQSTFVRSMEDTFPLTAWSVASSGGNFTQTINSPTYMMTTAQLVLLTYLDELQVNDKGSTNNRLVDRNEIIKFTLDPKSTATIDETLDSTSPNFMVWHDPVPIPNGCTSTPPVVYDATPTTGNPKPPNNNQAQNYNTLFTLIFGGGVPYIPCYPADQYGNVPSIQAKPLLQDSDFSDWRPVTFTNITVKENTSPTFYQLPSLRSAKTVALHAIREGFTGTLAFETNWGTNVTNESRVTTNQTLIVSIGQSIDGENTVALFPLNTTDADHASNPACTGCHSQLDPVKAFFNHTSSLFYSDQPDPTSLGTQAAFGIDGVTGKGIYTPDLFNILAGHTRLPLAWTQKLIFWATSVPAEETDPEVVRIANDFASSSFNFMTLAADVFTSPIVTFAAPTQTTTDNGVLNTIARADQWCAALSNRLGIVDVCGLRTPSPTNTQQTIAGRASLLPNDTYFRGYALPSLATDPSLVFRDTVENICGIIAGEVVDDNTDAGPSKYSSKNPTAAIADMVSNVMGIPSLDPRFQGATTILTNHFAAAEAIQAAPADALKSTFTLACTSPSSVLLGL